jgi:hypothetical protein
MWEETYGGKRLHHRGEGPVIMSETSSSRAKLALLVVAAAVAGALIALPATAYAAKSVTRMVVIKSLTVHNDTKGVNPWPRALGVKLQKRITGTHYHALKGTVKLYRYDPNVPSYKQVSSKTGSSLTFSLPGRGKYKLYYAGSTSTKSATALTGVYETIGATLGTPVVQFSSVDGTTTQTWVSVKHDVSWNTDAAKGPVWVSCEGWFKDSADTLYSTWFFYEREYHNPRTVEFNFKAESSDMLDFLVTEGHVYMAWWDRGDYVKTPAPLRHTEASH